jgi:hypothetical protein
MPYVQLSAKDAEQIREARRRKKDSYGIDWYLATHIAQDIFGKKGFANVQYQFTLNDPVDENNYVIPMGPLIGYEIGYMRKGKRRRILYTKWRGESYAEAFAGLYEDSIRKKTKIVDKVEKILMQYKIIT